MDSYFEDNTATRPFNSSGLSGGKGGAVYLGLPSANITVIASTFINNSVPFEEGGAIFTDFPLRVMLQDSLFADNWSGVSEGAVRTGPPPSAGSGTIAQVVNCTFRNNRAALHHAALTTPSETVILKDCTFEGNIAGRVFVCPSSSDAQTGGEYSALNVDSSGTVSISDCIFHNNSGTSSARVASDVRTEITNSIFSSNSGTVESGALTNGGPQVSLTNCTFEHNVGSGDAATIAITESTDVILEDLVCQHNKVW